MEWTREEKREKKEKLQGIHNRMFGAEVELEEKATV